LKGYQLLRVAGKQQGLDGVAKELGLRWARKSRKTEETEPEPSPARARAMGVIRRPSPSHSKPPINPWPLIWAAFLLPGCRLAPGIGGAREGAGRSANAGAAMPGSFRALRVGVSGPRESV